MITQLDNLRNHLRSLLQMRTF